jgi:hypothetical protein
MSNISNQPYKQPINNSSGALSELGMASQSSLKDLSTGLELSSEVAEVIKGKVHWLDVIDTMKAIWAKDESLILDFSPADEKDIL